MEINEGEVKKTEEVKKNENSFREVVKFALIAFIVIVPIRMYVAQPFIVSGSSMDPTFFNGQYLIVDELTYHFEDPKRGQVVIFKYPNDTKKFFIKRIIGLPEETVIIEKGTVTIKNAEHPEGMPLAEPYIDSENRKNDSMSITLKPGEYFVMGDNRIVSSDSRVWGPLKEGYIVGRPALRLLPLQKIGLFPGVHDQKAYENSDSKEKQ
jgi:signal peptidase I